jgi:excinuclease ABC subunit A
VVVEHDLAVMMAADRMIDMGPGPGESAPDVPDGTPGRPQTCRHADRRSTGSRKAYRPKRPVSDNTPRLILPKVRTTT